MAQSQRMATPQTESQTPLIDIAKFKATPLVTNPYEYVIVEGFTPMPASEKIVQDYPEISKRGSFPLHTLKYGPAFEQLLEELKSDAFRDAVAEKFSVDLAGKPTVITVRGMCGTKDGNIHTDTESKIISLLLYMNLTWDQNDGGKLRLLRSPSMDDVAEEVSPAAGTLLVFKRSDHSYHGHKLHIGPRKVIQMNWVTNQSFVENSAKRHGFSAFLKNLNPFKSEY